MQEFQPLRQIPADSYSHKDVLVVFGEVFARGYVNGLIDEAKKIGMKVIFSTVGRREEDNRLRALTKEELEQKEQPLINIPLECGFDLEKSERGLTPCEQVKGLKLSEASQAELDFAQVAQSRQKGRASFRTRLAQYLTELSGEIPSGAKVLIAHTMAGGVPRAKIILPVMNRVFKGHGDRFASSLEFWNSPLGRLSELSFMDVTTNSFSDLIELSEPLRREVQDVSYVAFGYHGTEILIGANYQWQSYAPYLQGFAKLELEQIATRAAKAGVRASVYNAPEILTNSSSIFLGVEVALYPLLAAFRKEAPGHAFTRRLLDECQALLKSGHTVAEISALTDSYFSSDIIAKRWSNYSAWPQHNGPEQMELMRTTSDKIVEMHQSDKHLLTAGLSEIVFKACGKAMIREGMAPRHPVWWIGHDLVAKLSL